MYSFGLSKFSKAFRLLTWPNKHVTILPSVQSGLQNKQKPNFSSCFDYKNLKNPIQVTHTEVCQVCLDPHVFFFKNMYPISNFDLCSMYRWDRESSSFNSWNFENFETPITILIVELGPQPYWFLTTKTQTFGLK